MKIIPSDLWAEITGRLVVEFQPEQIILKGVARVKAEMKRAHKYAPKPLQECCQGRIAAAHSAWLSLRISRRFLSR